MRLSLSPDLWRLVQDGYEVGVTEAGHLVISNVPYLDADGQLARGRLVSTLSLNGDIASYAGDHVAHFVGGIPCDRNGEELQHLQHLRGPIELEPGLAADLALSQKPVEGQYRDYHHKMTFYIELVTAHARSLDATVTAITHPPVIDDDPAGPFEYLDSASSRAGIASITDRLRLSKVVIVGLGGTGSYVLDLIAKTPIGAIHLYDGDDLYTHNAFRAPGAASLETLRMRPKKVDYLTSVYANMKRGIEAHPVFVDETNVDELRDADFVFLTMEGNESKRLIVDKLIEFEVPFIDVGIGINIVNGGLQGAVQTITRTPADVGRSPERHPIGYDGPQDDAYGTNIQIADLNALNATMAVIKWKKLFNFYLDTDDEHYSAYTIEWNQITSDDLA